MSFAKRNEILGNWNFSESAIAYGKQVKNKRDLVKSAKEVQKFACRLIELKQEQENLSGKEFPVMFSISDLGSVAVSATKVATFRCGSCDVGTATQEEAQGAAWALYQQALPKILKLNPSILEYSVDVKYNTIFKSVFVTMNFVFA